MNNKNKFNDMIKIAKDNNRMEDLNNIMDNYFSELEKHHPQTYVNLMREIHKLGAETNILDKDELDKYLKHIHHSGMLPLWTLEQTTKVAKDININFDEWKFNIYTFNYVMNMMRADYYAEFKKMFATSPLMKQTILESPSFYAHMAKAWLEDEDAPVDKAIRYIKYVSGEHNTIEEDK